MEELLRKLYEHMYPYQKDTNIKVDILSQAERNQLEKEDTFILL